MFWGNKDVIAVGGGKGGIGKSCFTANLGVSIAQSGRRVVLIDADLGAANLHTITGVAFPEKTLDDFLKTPHANLQDALLDTAYPNLKLLSSASDVLAISSPNYKERQKLYKGLQKLETDVIIFDIAAGTHQRATDFFSLAPIGVIIVEPVPTSLENAFSFLKNLLFRHLLRLFYQDAETRKFIQGTLDPAADNSNLLQFSQLLEQLSAASPDKVVAFRNQYQQSTKLMLVVNSVKNPSQGQVADKFTKIVKRYLSLTMHVLGNLPFEQNMDEAIIARMPFVSRYPSALYSIQMRDMAKKLPLRAIEGIS